MALNPKLLIGGAIAGILLLSGKKKAPASTSTDTKTDSKNDGKSDAGEPAGPNGCKAGLTEKNGICVDPNSPVEDKPGGSNPGGAGGGSKPASSELIISKDCKSFQFGDKTGDSWWKSKGEKVAKQWMQSGEYDPLAIAFQMIRKMGNCFKDFPTAENANHWFNLQLDRFEWINKNRGMWSLLWSVRNRVDVSLFNGTETVTADFSKPNLGLVFGKNGSNFNINKWLEMLKPMARMLIQITGQAAKNEMGPVATALGIKDINQNDYNNSFINIPTYLFTMIFPNQSIAEIKAKEGTLFNLDLWQKLQKFVIDYADEPLDLEGEGF